MVVIDEGDRGGETSGEDAHDGGELRKSRSLLEHTDGVVLRGGELKKSRSLLEHTDGVVVFRGGEL